MDPTRPIAYFCTEYALDPNLPIYAGGLGILAGDYLHEASDQKFPMVAVGLFYDTNNSVKLDIVKDYQGQPLRITVPIQDKKIIAQVFVFMVGTIPVYLLNTNITENDPPDRLITTKLYVTDKETRLKQELVLGIGGLRTLEALKIHPQLYHLNEGHSAFLSLELIRHEMQERQIGFAEAIPQAKKKIVFTNHTLVAAGREIYDDDLVALMLTGYAQELGVPVAEVLKLGLVQESTTFSMTILSLNMATKINAVSKLHGTRAADIWAKHPMLPITNGIHIATWDKVGNDVITGHLKHKQRLALQFGWDPKVLLLGWARRFVEYKRPLSILDNLDRFISIAQNSQYPVKMVFAGLPHETDEYGQELVKRLQFLIQDRLTGSVAYLPNYDLHIAEQLVSGCDVWLNTPIVGFEACGTSGMKAALNGTLPATTKDGWVDEVDLTHVGWILDNDHLEEHVLDALEHEIVPMYYQHPQDWQDRMQAARSLILSQFSTTRMLADYTQKLYK